MEILQAILGGLFICGYGFALCYGFAAIITVFTDKQK